MKSIEVHTMDATNNKIMQKRKTAERAASAKNYAHNVKG
jgi:hypothetical protein